MSRTISAMNSLSTHQRPISPWLTALAQRSDEQLPALTDDQQQLNYARLWQQVVSVANWLQQYPRVRVVALLADNCCEWVVVDLATQLAGKCLLPVPTFFSTEQQLHLLNDSSAQLLLVQHPQAHQELAATSPDLLQQAGFQPLPSATGELAAFSVGLRDGISTVDARVSKITYTSGTTGTPKGVCLSQTNLEAVCGALSDAIAEARVKRHLCLLPLAVLLENIAGVYLPLLIGAEILLPTPSGLGFHGSSSFNPVQLAAALSHWQPHSLLLTPELLKALLAMQEAAPLPASLRYIALGGGVTAPELVQQARALGWPVYQGYGLSECSSVVSLEPYSKPRPGSVGKPLPHVYVTLSAEGEVLVEGNAMLGYLGEPVSSPQHEHAPIRTGDLGEFDQDGYLYLRGRKKNTIVTGLGRNVSPEWLEAQLVTAGTVLQAYVYGDEQTPLTACLFAPQATDQQLYALLQQINQALPDYAHLQTWRRITTPLTAADGALTSNGRLRRHWLRQQADVSISSLPVSQAHYFGEQHELLPNTSSTDC